MVLLLPTLLAMSICLPGLASSADTVVLPVAVGVKYTDRDPVALTWKGNLTYAAVPLPRDEAERLLGNTGRVFVSSHDQSYSNHAHNDQGSQEGTLSIRLDLVAGGTLDEKIKAINTNWFGTGSPAVGTTTTIADSHYGSVHRQECFGVFVNAKEQWPTVHRGESPNDMATGGRCVEVGATDGVECSFDSGHLMIEHGTIPVGKPHTASGTVKMTCSGPVKTSLQAYGDFADMDVSVTSAREGGRPSGYGATATTVTVTSTVHANLAAGKFTRSGVLMVSIE